MNYSFDTIKKSKIYTALDAAFQIVFGVYLFFLLTSMTTFYAPFPAWTNKVLILMLACVSFIKSAFYLIYDKANQSNKRMVILLAAVLCLNYIVIYKLNSHVFLIAIAILTIGTIGSDYERLIKIYTGIALVVIAAAMIASLTGAIDNMVYTRDATIRSSWGLTYPTNFAAILFYTNIFLWISTKKASVWISLISTLIGILLSHFIADGRASTLCCMILLLAIIYEAASRYGLLRSDIIAKSIGILACLMFPLMTIATGSIVIAYRKGNSFAQTIDSVMSGRIMLSNAAIDQFGIRMFGTEFDQASGIFVDITYMQLLVQCGIVLLLIMNILWMLMTHRAFKIGDRRLALSLAIIAIHCASEQRLMEPAFNVLIIMPFAVLLAGNKVVDGAVSQSCERNYRQRLIKAAILTITLLFIVGAIPVALAWSRTAWAVAKSRFDLGRLDTFAAYLGISTCLIGLIILVSYITIHLIEKRPIEQEYKIAVEVLIVAVCIGVVGGSLLIRGAAHREQKTIDTETAIIEAIDKAGNGDIYVCDKPWFYKHTGIKNEIRNGDELIVYPGATVITMADTDSSLYFDRGYLYSQISDNHAVYTKNSDVLEALKTAGYITQGYCSAPREVNFSKRITKTSVKPGRYRALVNIRLLESNKDRNMTEASAVQIVSTIGQGVIAEKEVSPEEFDKDGACTIEIGFANNTEQALKFKVKSQGKKEIRMTSISYQRDPIYDTQFLLDEKGRRVKEEYYDENGDRTYNTAGVGVIQREYDDSNRVTKEEYYDIDEDLCNSNDGYAIFKNKYDGNGRLIRQEYYDDKGKSISNSSGYAAIEFKYDEMGCQTEVRYYANDGNPVMLDAGYSTVKRLFDDNRRKIAENYYDDENKPCKSSGGYASISYEYDEMGRVATQKYYDEYGKSTNTDNGYSQINWEYNELSQIVKETYLNNDGEKTSTDAGYAGVMYKYDGMGYQTEMQYIDINNEPAYVWGRYNIVRRTYDDAGHIVKEQYCDEFGEPAENEEGYSEVKRYYNKRYRLIKEEYRDLNGRIIKSFETDETAA